MVMPSSLYDQPADRWVFAQFAVSSGNQDVCLAVSQTGDPTGAFWLYSVTTPKFPDYFKLGVWPDPANNAYFMGTITGLGGEYDIMALDRDKMLAGVAARPMQVFQNHPNLLMPADVDGPNLPPHRGSSTLFEMAASHTSAIPPHLASTSGSSMSTGPRRRSRPSPRSKRSDRPRVWSTSTGQSVASSNRPVCHSLDPIPATTSSARIVSIVLRGGRCKGSNTATSAPTRRWWAPSMCPESVDRYQS